MRVKSSLLNLAVAIIGQILGIVVSFFARLVFLQILGTEYLGLNGLFTNIISILSLVELGIGPAIVYSLYKPLAEKDIEKIKSLMRLFQKAYIIIGISILILGLCFTPFLSGFIKGVPNISHIHFIFLLFVINAAVSYFYSYKRSLIIADQKRYIATAYRYSFFIILNIIQVIVLYLTQNFIFFTICQVIITFVENFFVSKKADRLYPYLRDKDVKKIDKNTLNQISKNVRALIVHKIGGIVVKSTDNLIISKFVGLVGVGLYSNYLLIINALDMITSQLFGSITASVGNLGATETNEKKKFIFNVVFFINFWVFGFISICLLVLLNPFIKLWIGQKYILETSVVLIIILNFYLSGMRKGVLTFRDAFGLYWYDRYKPIFEVVINLVISLILVKDFGILGVLIGTTVSSVLTCFWVEPYVLYKYGFKTSVFPYFVKYIYYTIITILTGLFTMGITTFFQNDGFVSFAVQLIFCITIPNIVFLLIFYRTKEFRYLFNIFSKIILSKAE